MATPKESVPGAQDETANPKSPSTAAGAVTETTEPEAEITKPQGLTRGQRIRKFFHNSETGEYMGRTCISWARIFVYYLVFYAFLCTVFCGLLLAFLHTLSESEPYFTKDDSILGSSPGLDFFPAPYTAGKDSDLIWFNIAANDKDANWHYYVREIEKRLNTYYYDKSPVASCSSSMKSSSTTTCEFIVDSSNLGPCGHSDRDDKFGYDVGEPCIYLSLNRIFDWSPKTYEAKGDLPSGAPSTLNGAFAGSTPLVLVECNGENAEDQMNLGSLTYFPQQGFPTYYFPYKKQPDGYFNPLVAVKFNGIMKNTLVNIRCNAWAKNIKRDVRKRIGSVRFSIIIDSPKP